METDPYITRFVKDYRLSPDEEAKLLALPEGSLYEVVSTASRMTPPKGSERAREIVMTLIAIERSRPPRWPPPPPPPRREPEPVSPALESPPPSLLRDRRRRAHATVDTRALHPGDVVLITYGPYGTQIAHVRKVLRTGSLHVDRLFGRGGWRQSAGGVPAENVLEVLQPGDQRRTAALASLPREWHVPVEHEPNAWRGGFRGRRVDPEEQVRQRVREREAEEQSAAYQVTRHRLLAGLVPIDFGDLRSKYGVNLNDMEHEAVATAYSTRTGEVISYLSVYPGVGVTETGHSTRIWVYPAFLQTLAEA